MDHNEKEAAILMKKTIVELGWIILLYNVIMTISFGYLWCRLMFDIT
jgi:hypothetical protein